MDALIEEETPCRDPECSGIAEPEVDGGYRFYECPECGFLFGYSRVEQPDDVCGIGVPEEVRRAASIAPGKRMIPLMVKPR